MSNLPASFLETIRQQLGSEFPDFVEALEQPTPTAIRYNPFKQSNWKENSDKVKWCAEGVYLEERPVFTLDPSFHAGAYYVQEASSMFIAEVLRQSVSLDQPLRVLDMAAAPGGKSTLLAGSLSADSLLVANEVIKSRYQIVNYNLAKWGTPNIVTTNHDSKDFRKLEGFFDLVLLDAPCSGEGLFRKDPKAVQEWSPEQVSLCAARQQRIMAESLPLLRPGGIFIYSTCTYNALENDENIDWLLQAFPFEVERLDIPEDWGIVTTRYGYQFYPHRVRGEGLYISILRKTGGSTFKEQAKDKRIRQFVPLSNNQRQPLQKWLQDPEQFNFFQNEKGAVLAVPASLHQSCSLIAQQLGRLQCGLYLGQLKHKGFVPAAQLALSTVLARDLPRIALDRAQALAYLHKDDLPTGLFEEGLQLVEYKKLPLGWVKGLKNRVNNYYPKEWRIRMAIS